MNSNFAITFLQELADGAEPSLSLISQLISKYGPEVVLANLSPKQAKAVDLMTPDICGPPGTFSSLSVSLQLSLENRLRHLQGLGGSTLYSLTWKHKATPAQRRICALRASASPTYDKDSGLLVRGWTTPTSRDYKDSYGQNTSADQMPRQAFLMSLESLATGSVQFNPELAAWAMGFPTEWDVFRDSETQSYLW